MSDKSPAPPSDEIRSASEHEDEAHLHEDPDLISLDSQAAHSRKASFFHKLNKSRHKAPSAAAVMPHSFHRWTHRKAKEHIQPEQAGQGGPGGSDDEEANAGTHPNEQHDDPDRPGFRMKNRYLPIISGLACPFSVLLDVSIDWIWCRWRVADKG